MSLEQSEPAATTVVVDVYQEQSIESQSSRAAERDLSGMRTAPHDTSYLTSNVAPMALIQTTRTPSRCSKATHSDAANIIVIPSSATTVGSAIQTTRARSQSVGLSI